MKFKQLLLGTLLSGLIATQAFGAISLNIDGKDIVTDVSPTIIDGRTLVPVRSIFEELGATVQWDDATKTVTANRGTTSISLVLNSNTAVINGKNETLDVPAQSIDGRTMVPARFIAEALGCEVNWNPDTQTVSVSTSTTQQQQNANTYKVIRVVDGDTFIIDYNGTEERVRLIGVDTPESVHPDASKNTAEGVSASEYTKSLIEGKNVELEFDVQQRDIYGRLLAYVYVDGYMLNKKLLEDGYAVIATYPPNVKYVDEFEAIAGVSDNSADNNTTTDKTEETNTNSNSSNSGAVDLTEATYIGNSNTMKFHLPSCSSADKISQENKVGLPDRDTAISQGYTPCGICKP